MWKGDKKKTIRNLHWAKVDGSYCNLLPFWKLCNRPTDSYNDQLFVGSRLFHAQIFKRRQQQFTPIFQIYKEAPLIQAKKPLMGRNKHAHNFLMAITS